MTNRRELADRLEAAECGSRELDAAVGDALNWRLTDGFWVYPAYVTSSLDAAIALAERLLPGWYVRVQGCNQSWFAQINPTTSGYHKSFAANGSSSALALCAAILRARLDDEGKGGEA